MPAFLAPLAIGVAGALGNALANRKKSNTATSQSTSRTTASDSSTMARNLLPEQQNALAAVNARLHSLYNPGASLEPLRAAMRTQNNARYSGMPQSIADKTMAHGGRSGQFGAGLMSAELARLGGLAGVDSDIARLGLEQQRQGDNLAMGLIGQNFGMSTSGTSTRDTTGSGTQTGPSDPFAAGLMGGAASASSLMTLLQLDKLLKGGGGAGMGNS